MTPYVTQGLKIAIKGFSVQYWPVSILKNIIIVFINNQLEFHIHVHLVFFPIEI